MINKLKQNRIGRFCMLFFANILSLLNQVIPKDRRKVLFYDSARDFLDDNTEAIYTYFIEHGYGEKYKLVCCVPNAKDHLPPFAGYKVVGPLSGMMAFLTAKYVLYSFGDFRIRPAKRQIVVNQWHGTPLKKIGKLMYDENYQRERLDNFTYLLTSGDAYVPIMASAFDCDQGKVKVVGNARNDYLFSCKETLDRIGIAKNKYKKLILWMPTFRKSNDERFHDGDVSVGETMLPIVETFSQMEVLNQELQDMKILLVIKIHPMALYRKTVYSNIKMVTNDDIVTKGVKLYELIKDFDAMITDYSSIYCDWLALDRPIAFTLDDYKMYEETRGFVFKDMIKYLAGYHIYDLQQLISFFKDMSNGNDMYRDDRSDVADLFCKFRDANNCKRLADLMGI